MKIRVCTANGQNSPHTWEAPDGAQLVVGPEWSEQFVSPLTADVLRIDPNFRIEVLEDEPPKNIEQLQRLIKPA